MVFDFDGIVVDSEPVHFEAFRQVLATAGVDLAREDYYGRYLGFDDHDCFAGAMRDKGRRADEATIADMIRRKTAIIQRAFAGSVRPLPGAVELIRAAATAGIPLAVCSGALRKEIELASRAVGVWECFTAIVPAEDVRRGKPDPEGYRLALRRLAAATGRKPRAGRCLAVEDAPAGIQAAKAVGMKVLAVTNSYPAAQLAAADRVVGSLAGLAPSGLEELL